jgi:hypothetical protein
LRDDAAASHLPFPVLPEQRTVIDQRAVSAAWQHAWQISGRENV